MTGRDGFSSDDLLRQAREAIARKDVTENDDERAASSRTEPTAPPPDPSPTLPRFETVAAEPYEPHEEPDRLVSERPRPATDGMVRPTDRIATGVPPSTKRRPAVAVGIAIAIFSVGFAVFVAGLVDDSTDVQNVGVGTCLNDPGGEVVTGIDPIPCDEPHQFEMIGSVKIPGDAFPGNDESFDLAIDRCVPMFEEYVGIAYQDSLWWLNAFTPTAEGWESGDRIANCLVFQFDDDRNIVSVTGSARGDGR